MSAPSHLMPPTGPPRAARGERILLLRSGRHLRVAMEALAARYPGCHVGVVGTTGAESAIGQAGVAPADCFIYSGRPRFEPLAFFFSMTALAVRRWRYDRVAILWNDPDGSGQGNVDRTALGLSPFGYHAITPDGTIVDRSPWPQLRRECVRLVVSAGMSAALGVLLYAPAWLLGGGARRAARRLEPARTEAMPAVAASGRRGRGVTAIVRAVFRHPDPAAEPRSPALAESEGRMARAAVVLGRLNAASSAAERGNVVAFRRPGPGPR